MERDAIIDLLVLNEVSDDYENVAQIAKGIAHLPFAVAMEIGVGEVISSLVRLVDSGYIGAFDLTTTPPLSEDDAGRLVAAGIDRFWFLQTPSGKILHASLPWPPDQCETETGEAHGEAPE